MAGLIAAVGPCRLPVRRPRFASLVRAIVAQQVSTAAARAVYGRLRGAAGGHISAKRLASLDETQLRLAGLSRQKTDYVRDLTGRVLRRELCLESVSKLSDDDVIAQLTRIKGIGRWTAEMFLIFVLNRPDVLPVDDLGIQKGFARVYGLRRRPGPDRMRNLAHCWQPYRTVGCWYLWRSLDALPDS